MSVRKAIYALAMLITSLFVCMPAAFCEAIETVLPERVEISITETDCVEKLGKGEYAIAVYPNWETVAINGVWDGESDVTVTLCSGGHEGTDFDFIMNDDGTWQCVIPVEVLTPNARNYLEVLYTDGSQEPVCCEITVDFVCELELDDVYEAENRVAGTTEPGADVYMYAGDTEYHTVTGSDGKFWFDVDFSQAESTEGWIVRSTDVYGNIAELGVSVTDAEITVSAPEMIVSEKVRVDVTAIAGSSVQLIVNGETWGESFKVDRQGLGHIFVYGLEHDGEYEISAVYCGRFTGYAEAAAPVTVAVDMQGPEVSTECEYLFMGDEEFVVDVEEKCILVVAEKYSGFEYSTQCEKGSNTVEISELTDVEYGMEFIVYAVDAAGNTSPAPVLLTVRIPADELVCFEGRSIYDGYTVDAMEPFVLKCAMYVPDENCSLNLFIINDETGDMEKINFIPIPAVEAPKDAPLDAMVPVEMTIDAARLPFGEKLSVGFCTVDADGTAEDMELWPRLSLNLEKDYAKLFLLGGMFVLALTCFAVAARMYAKINRRQRELKRSSGALKDSRSGRKRGGAWA